MKNSKELRQTTGTQAASLPALANLTAFAGGRGGFAKVPELWREARSSPSTWAVSTLSPRSPGQGQPAPSGQSLQSSVHTRLPLQHLHCSGGPRAELSAPNSEPPRQAALTSSGDSGAPSVSAARMRGAFSTRQSHRNRGRGAPQPYLQHLLQEALLPESRGGGPGRSGSPCPGPWGLGTLLTVPCCPPTVSGKAHSPCVDVTAAVHACLQKEPLFLS